MKKLFISLSFLFTLGCIAFAQTSGNRDNYTVIVSLDAFRWDYPQIHYTPCLDKMAREGVQAVMLPSYPASTFPNHYTLATGLVPDHNGIVNNTFWDAVSQRAYSMGDSLTRNNPSYYLGEPIWITAQKQGVKTGNVYWVGSDIPIKREVPTYHKVWADTPRLTFSERVDEVVRLLGMPDEERPRLVMVYFEEPDHSGHAYGPYGEETRQVVASLDSLMGSLWQRIRTLPIGDRVNLIVTADHGMTEISDERFIRVSDYIKPEWCEKMIAVNPTSIFTKEGCRDSVLLALKGVEHIYAWKKEGVPAELMYGRSDRLGDVIVAPELGWQFADKPRHLKGGHGYFPQSLDMQVIFRACGPDFKKGYEAAAFINVDIYTLLSHLLGIVPEPTDGRWERVKNMLQWQESRM